MMAHGAEIRKPYLEMPAKKGSHKSTALIVTATASLAVMTAFEIVKRLLYPAITLWESHIVTILVVSAFAVIAAYIVLRQRDRLYGHEESFRIIADFTYDWEYWLGPDNRFLYISPSCERVTGYVYRELMRVDVFESIIHEEDRAVAHAQIFRDETSLEPVESEFRIIRRDGETRWIGHASQPVQSETGQYLGRRASNRDITKRKKAELALRRSEMLYREIARNLPDSIVSVVDADLRFLVAEGSFLPRTGLSREQLEGRLPHEVLPAEVSTLIEPRYRLALSGKTAEYEVAMYGRMFWSKYVPVRGEGGSLIGAMGMVTDITERKRSEKLIERARILQQTPDAIVAVDNDYIIRYVNPAVFRQYELDPNTPLIGSRLGEYYQYEWITDTQQREAFEALERTGAWNGINIHITGKGARIWVESQVSAVRDSRGNRIGMVAVMRDTTKRKEIEDECTRISRELTETNRELESFSYSVSHDLRAPLRAMKGFSEILLEDYREGLNEEGREYLARIVAGADRMDALIEDMLTLSRIGRQEMAPGEVNLSELAAAIFAEFRQAHPERRADIRIQENMIVSGDARLLRIALTNLLGNAWKYTSRTAEPVIEFGIIDEREKAGDRRLEGRSVFYVRDNGAGFPMDRADKLFQPFGRLHSDSQFPGTGIGLPIAARVVTRHGGTIWAESEIGNGARFFFTLGA